jgi:hypothetical protein
MFDNVAKINETEFISVCKKIAGDKLDNLLTYMNKSGFYSATAAKKYHDNYPGGLYDHSKRVFSELCNLRSKLNKDWSDLELIIIAFGHDLCKVEQYLPIIKDGIVTYDYAPGSSMSIHASRSLEILAETIPELITKRMALAVLYHMGIWTTDVPDLANKMKDAQSEDDLVFFTHCADMIASKCGKVANKIILDENSGNITIE